MSVSQSASKKASGFNSLAFHSYVASVSDGVDLVREELQDIFAAMVKMSYLVHTRQIEEGNQLLDEAKAAYASAHQQLIGIEHGLLSPLFEQVACGQDDDAENDFAAVDAAAEE